MSISIQKRIIKKCNEFREVQRENPRIGKNLNFLRKLKMAKFFEIFSSQISSRLFASSIGKFFEWILAFVSNCILRRWPF